MLFGKVETRENILHPFFFLNIGIRVERIKKDLIIRFVNSYPFYKIKLDYFSTVGGKIYRKFKYFTFVLLKRDAKDKMDN